MTENPDQPEQKIFCECDHVQATELHISGKRTGKVLLYISDRFIFETEEIGLVK